MIRVLIADDHPLVRTALARLLGCFEDIKVVAVVADGRDAVRLAKQTRPEVMLMDLHMPRLDGISAMLELRSAGSRAAIVVLTAASDRDRIREAADAGAFSFLLKDADPDVIVSRVRAAAAAARAGIVQGASS